MICIRKKLSILLLAAALTGCVTGRPLREIAVDSNRLAARTADEQTMLNILRAKDRMPMHFTSFTVLRGSISVSGNVGVGSEFPSGALETETAPKNAVTTTVKQAIDKVSPSVGATMTSSPSFEMAVFDTQEFQQGILTPVGAPVMEYFLQQGWPEDLLTALLISHVEIEYDGKRVVLRNHASEDEVFVFSSSGEAPKNFKGGFRFDEFLAQTTMVSTITKASSQPLFPLTRLGDSIDLADLATLDGKSFDLVATKDGPPNVVRKIAGGRGVSFQFNSPALLNSLLKLIGAPPLAKPNLCAGSDETGLTKSFLASGSCSAAPPDAKNATITAYSRSPEGMLYFLGSYVRNQAAAPDSVYSLPGGSRIITLSKQGDASTLLKVRYRGDVWSLEDPGMTSTNQGPSAITLAQQLVNLQKKASSLPTSNAIQILPN